jgi:hypothetical protein
MILYIFIILHNLTINELKNLNKHRVSKFDANKNL